MNTDELFQEGGYQTPSPSLHISFRVRQGNLFKQLDIAEKNNKNRIISSEGPIDVDSVCTVKPRGQKRTPTKYLRGKESIFKRPEDPISKCLPVRKLPDFRKNPHKWVKYSLSNVDTSDKGNTNAALSFLREMEKRKQNESSEDMETESSSTITFKKPTKKPQPKFNISSAIQVNEKEDEEKAGFRGTKIVMPEYVIGQKKKTVKKNTSNAQTSLVKTKEIKLDHLLDEDE